MEARLRMICKSTLLQINAEKKLTKKVLKQFMRECESSAREPRKRIELFPRIFTSAIEGVVANFFGGFRIIKGIEAESIISKAFNDKIVRSGFAKICEQISLRQLPCCSDTSDSVAVSVVCNHHDRFKIQHPAIFNALHEGKTKKVFPLFYIKKKDLYVGGYGDFVLRGGEFYSGLFSKFAETIDPIGNEKERKRIRADRSLSGVYYLLRRRSTLVKHLLLKSLEKSDYAESYFWAKFCLSFSKDEMSRANLPNLIQVTPSWLVCENCRRLSPRIRRGQRFCRGGNCKKKHWEKIHRPRHGADGLKDPFPLLRLAQRLREMKRPSKQQEVPR